MRNILWLIAALFFTPSPSFACSCSRSPDEKPIQETATRIFIGEIVSQTHVMVPSGFLPRKNSDLPENHTEAAKILVKKAWKGVQVGQTVTFTSEFQGRRGMCGDSFWARSALEHMLLKEKAGRPPIKAKTFLIMISGEEPYSLDLCDYAEPLETSYAKDMIKTLDSSSSSR